MKSTVFKATFFVMTVQTTTIVADTKAKACRKTNNKETIMCSAEVKECPNGVDFVSRDTTDPNCAFFLCPIVNNNGDIDCDVVDFAQLKSLASNDEIGDNFRSCQDSLDEDPLNADPDVFSDIFRLFRNFEPQNAFEIETNLKEIKDKICGQDSCKVALDSLFDAIDAFSPPIPQECVEDGDSHFAFSMFFSGSDLANLCDEVQDDDGGDIAGPVPAETKVCEDGAFDGVIAALKAFPTDIANAELVSECQTDVNSNPDLLESFNALLSSFATFEIGNSATLITDLATFKADFGEALCAISSCTGALDLLDVALNNEDLQIPQCSIEGTFPSTIVLRILNVCITGSEDFIGLPGGVALNGDTPIMTLTALDGATQQNDVLPFTAARGAEGVPEP